ncbi:MAG: Fic family protein [Leptothrix sp. (in: b-proteobacteria)]
MSLPESTPSPSVAADPSSEVQERLLVEIARHPTGLGLEALHVALGGQPARRTLQRWLAELVRQGRVMTQGVGRALRYGPVLIAPASATKDDAPANDDIPVSPQGEAIQRHVRQPLHQRRPTGYQLGFLEAYTPNVTFYLSDTLRAQLQAMGRSRIQTQAPAGTFARDILNRLLIDLSWASSRLEGNTYTRFDTERLIDLGQAAEGKAAFEAQMILNHKAAIEFLVGDERVGVDTATVLALHALLSDGLLSDAMAGGRVRWRAVEIGASVYRPIALPQRLEELFGIVMAMAAEIDDPFEQAFFLMVQLPYLQPFEDVNKRVSRLAANIPLIRHNLCPLSFIDVPAQVYVDGLLGVYELNQIDLLRDVFVWTYERSCQQYVAVRQQLVPPDTFRLRYRMELGVAVKAIVQGGLPLEHTSIEQVTPATVATDDRPRFTRQVHDEFATLHEGNAVRFGLRPLELAAWREAERSAGQTD